MTEHKPFIDFENLPAPTEGFVVTHFLTVRSVAKSRSFYSEVLGGQVVLEENPCMIKLSNSWLIMNPGGGPTPDKPDVSVVNYEPGNTVSSFLNLRVADIHACYEQWSSKGAEFITPPTRDADQGAAGGPGFVWAETQQANDPDRDRHLASSPTARCADRCWNTSHDRRRRRNPCHA